MSEKQPAVYIVTNKPEGVLYTGVTSHLMKRAYEHRESLVGGFTKQYNCKKLVYYELHATMESAIMREKKIKKMLRQHKLNMVAAFNAHWSDLYDDICQ